VPSASAPPAPSSASREGVLREADWAPGPCRPRLTPRSLHVWRADLSDVADEVREWLSREEAERAAGFADRRRGLMWARARGVLRGLLATYLRVEPAALELSLGARGKPEVDSPPGAGVSFNVSHSRSIALYAFSQAAPVGVDVQTAPGRSIDMPAIARRAFGGREARRLAALEPGQLEREFLCAWTRHEAALKCLGKGIGGGVSDASGPGARARLWVCQLELGGGGAAAVALPAEPDQMRCWSWSSAGEAICGADAERARGRSSSFFRRRSARDRRRGT
jgi:4'-phosphopantetheinyl transferase